MRQSWIFITFITAGVVYVNNLPAAFGSSHALFALFGTVIFCGVWLAAILSSFNYEKSSRSNYASYYYAPLFWTFMALSALVALLGLFFPAWEWMATCAILIPLMPLIGIGYFELPAVGLFSILILMLSFFLMISMLPCRKYAKRLAGK